MIWTEGLDNLKIFIDYLNNIHPTVPTIKFTSSHSSTNVSFLDVNVSLTNDGNISTDLSRTKPTDKHQLLPDCIHLAMSYIQKTLFLSVLHSAYDVFVLLTKRLIYALLNLLHTYSNVATNETLSLNKYNVPPTSHADSLYKLKT